ncbi:MAG TPA: hypothetical protein VIN05_06650 [Roseovarius sp.]
MKRDKPDALAVPEAPNVTWSMDFMADRLDAAADLRRYPVELLHDGLIFAMECKAFAIFDVNL